MAFLVRRPCICINWFVPYKQTFIHPAFIAAQILHKQGLPRFPCGIAFSIPALPSRLPWMPTLVPPPPTAPSARNLIARPLLAWYRIFAAKLLLTQSPFISSQTTLAKPAWTFNCPSSCLSGPLPLPPVTINKSRRKLERQGTKYHTFPPPLSGPLFTPCARETPCSHMLHSPGTARKNAARRNAAKALQSRFGHSPKTIRMKNSPTNSAQPLCSQACHSMNLNRRWQSKLNVG